jgi:hypothetical protein
MSVLVTSPFTHISSNIHSHRAAQGAIYADQLESTGNTVHLDRTGNIAPDINAFTEMYVYHGNDWGGSLNLFGGMKNYSGINNLIRYSQFTGTVYSLWIDHPKYSEMLEPRMAGDIHPDWHKVNWENLKRIENTAVTIKNILSTNKVVIGDSHAISLYRTGWHVKSIPFKTLHGALKEDLNTFVDPDKLISDKDDYMYKLYTKYLRKNIPINYTNIPDITIDPLTFVLLIKPSDLIKFIKTDTNKHKKMLDLYSAYITSKKNLKNTDIKYNDKCIELAINKKEFDKEMYNIGNYFLDIKENNTYDDDKNKTEKIERIISLKVGYMSFIFELADIINEIYTSQTVYFTATKELLIEMQQI